jgi:hypothetical protein
VRVRGANRPSPGAHWPFGDLKGDYESDLARAVQVLLNWASIVF